jgi:hypothetical protein
MTRLLVALLLAGLVTFTGCRTADVITTPAPAAATPATAATLPAGTTLEVRLQDAIGTEISTVGQTFTAEVVSPVVAQDGQTAVPAGAMVRGTVTGLAPSEQVGDQAAIRVDFNQLQINGQTHPIDATVVDAGARTEEGDAILGDETAIGAGVGAGLGLILEGDLAGALLGGILGAGVGTVIALGTGDVEATLPAGSTMTIRTTDRVALR